MKQTELLNTIRVEIKRRLADYSEDTQFEKGERYGYKQILSFLDTIEKEQENDTDR